MFYIKKLLVAYGLVGYATDFCTEGSIPGQGMARIQCGPSTLPAYSDTSQKVALDKSISENNNNNNKNNMFTYLELWLRLLLRC